MTNWQIFSFLLSNISPMPYNYADGHHRPKSAFYSNNSLPCGGQAKVSKSGGVYSAGYFLFMIDTDSKPNLARFVDIIDNVVNKKPATVAKDLKPSGVYQPPHLAPVFFDDSKSKSAVERAKLRAARFILEDLDLNESEDLPKEIYLRGRKLRSSESNKQEKRLQRSLLPGGLSDTSSRLRQMQILLQSSDEEMAYKPPPTKILSNWSVTMRRDILHIVSATCHKRLVMNHFFGE
ncbi:unnamed protein product [Heterobilharzia americana]|nr:unnamed protein product [Heterobilharzia americana]